mmetsp:Transcript_20887/g.39045  ORF Transcript_20887/g.39045 Transcript_20887/m.39045 type:complete len:267 (+) Transcript_20887:1245-2045(+)
MSFPAFSLAFFKSASSWEIRSASALDRTSKTSLLTPPPPPPPSRRLIASSFAALSRLSCSSRLAVFSTSFSSSLSLLASCLSTEAMVDLSSTFSWFNRSIFPLLLFTSSSIFSLLPAETHTCTSLGSPFSAPPPPPSRLFSSSSWRSRTCLFSFKISSSFFATSPRSSSTVVSSTKPPFSTTPPGLLNLPSSDLSCSTSWLSIFSCMLFKRCSKVSLLTVASRLFRLLSSPALAGVTNPASPPSIELLYTANSASHMLSPVSLLMK